MILDGKLVSKEIKNNIKSTIDSYIAAGLRKPKIVIIQVGEVMASNIYVKNKLKACAYVGMDAEHIKLSENISELELLNIINDLNINNCIDGLIVQLPLPKHINEQHIINSIDSAKDVDGFGLVSKGKLFSGLSGFKSATPYGIIKLLEYYNIEIQGKKACVIGRSNIVGKPMAIMLLDKNATVTICHSKTNNLAETTKQADILISAVGKAKFVTKDMIKPGCVVIDVGMNRDENGLCGDVDFVEVEPIASYITPVPGGVGPLTITMLLSNTLEAYKNKI